MIAITLQRLPAAPTPRRALAACAVLLASLAAADPDTGGHADRARVRDEIWARELAIYAGRGAGDLRPYLQALASDYRAWPPFRERPAGAEGLQDLAVRMRGQDQEELEMTLLAFSLNGDTASVYYETHRTRRADGSPADDHYEVVHVWVREAGDWRVFAGMARERPER